MTGDPIYRHHHQLPKVKYTNTNDSNDRQQDIIDIKPTSASDSEDISVGGASQEGVSDIDDEVDPKLCFSNIFPLLLLFRKAGLSFIVVFGTYISVDEIMKRLSGRALQTNRIKN